MTFDSLPSVESANLEQYWNIVRKLEPDFYHIRYLLEQTGVNPSILSKVIRGISNMAIGAGYGRVIIYMRNKQITSVETAEEDKLDQPAMVSRERLEVIQK